MWGYIFQILQCPLAQLMAMRGCENVANLLKIVMQCNPSLSQTWLPKLACTLGRPSHLPPLMCVLSLREEASCWVSVEQSPFVLGLTSENGELLLDECVQVTEGSKTKERHLFLFSDVIVFAKLKWEVLNIYLCLKTCWSPAIYSKMWRKSVSTEQNATLGNYWINWQKIINKQWKCNWKCWSGVLVSFAWKMS